MLQYSPVTRAGCFRSDPFCDCWAAIAAGLQVGGIFPGLFFCEVGLDCCKYLGSQTWPQPFWLHGLAMIIACVMVLGKTPGVPGCDTRP